MGYARTLDLRELADQWQAELDEEVGRTAWNELCNDIGCDVTPNGLRDYGDSYEPTLINANDFTEYAQELAEDCGMVPDNLQWPVSCIDWQQAARELEYDYSLVRFDGVDYYIRTV